MTSDQNDVDPDGSDLDSPPSRTDAAHDAAVSSGVPGENAASTADNGLDDTETTADTVAGALSPGSTATSAPTDLD